MQKNYAAYLAALKLGRDNDEAWAAYLAAEQADALWLEFINKPSPPLLAVARDVD